MKRILEQLICFLFVQALFIACAHSPKNSDGMEPSMQRAPASLPMDSATLKKFEDLFRLPAGEAFANIQLQFESYMSSYLRGQNELKTFDERLVTLAKDTQRPTDADALADSSYLRLQARHMDLWEKRYQIQMIYARLTDMEMDPASEQEDRMQARKIRLQVHRYLKEQGRGAHLLALAPLILDFHLVRNISVNSPLRRPALSEGETQRRSGEMDAELLRRAQRPHLLLEDLSYSLKLEAQNLAKTPDAADEQRIAALQEQLEKDLRFKVADRIPQGNVYKSSADRNGVLVGSEFSPDTWVLTYGEGPVDSDVVGLLNDLKKRSVSATFFFVQNHLQNRANSIEDFKYPGLLIGSRSYSYANTALLPNEQKMFEVKQSLIGLTQMTGSPVKYYRSPVGIGLQDPVVRNAVAEQGALYIHWNVDALDWLDNNPQSIYERVRRQMQIQRRGIIHFNDVRGPTVEASKRLMAQFTQEKVQVKSMEDAINEINAF